MRTGNETATNSCLYGIVFLFANVETIEETLRPYKEQIGEKFDRLVEECKRLAKPCDGTPWFDCTKEDFRNEAYSKAADEVKDKMFSGDWARAYNWRFEHAEEFENLVQKKQNELFEGYLNAFENAGCYAIVECADLEESLNTVIKNIPFAKKLP